MVYKWKIIKPLNLPLNWDAWTWLQECLTSQVAVVTDLELGCTLKMFMLPLRTIQKGNKWKRSYGFANRWYSEKAYVFAQSNPVKCLNQQNSEETVWIWFESTITLLGSPLNWIDWLIDWLIDWFVNQSIDWLIDRLIDWSIDWLID